MTISASSGPAGSLDRLRRGLAVQAGHRRQRVLGGGGESLRDDLEQLGQPDALRGGSRQHRVERAPGDGGLQVVDQDLGVDLLTGQVPVHEGLVLALLDDRLDERGAGLLDPVGVSGLDVGVGPAVAGVVIKALGQQPDQAAHPALIVGNGQVQRRDGLAEGVPAGSQRLVDSRRADDRPW